MQLDQLILFLHSHFRGHTDVNYTSQEEKVQMHFVPTTSHMDGHITTSDHNTNEFTMAAKEIEAGSASSTPPTLSRFNEYQPLASKPFNIFSIS